MKTILARLEEMFPGAKKTTLREMVERKRVQLNGRKVRSLKETVADGAKVEVTDLGPAHAEKVLLEEGLQIVFMDADMVIVNKPAGLLTATDAQEKRPTAWRILQDYFGKQNHRFQIHLIHRLDRDASGLLVFARNWDAYTALKQQFFEHTITRVYEVIVHGVPREAKGRLEDLLVEDLRGVVHITKDMKKGQLAILDYQVVEAAPERGLARLRCMLHTGRKHQIRVQLAARGHAVCGDAVYGKGEEPPYRLALHAARLSLAHPRTRKVASFESPAPGAMGHMLRGNNPSGGQAPLVHPEPAGRAGHAGPRG